MADPMYWLDLFTPQTWQEFIDAGSTVSGFRESRWTSVQKIQEGDYLLCYLTGVSRWVGVLEVKSKKPFIDKSPIWKDDVFPCRVKVKSLIQLTPETGIPVKELKDSLSAFKSDKAESYSLAWTGRFRGSPAKWSKADGDAVLAALLNAKKNPKLTPIDPKKIGYKPKAMEGKIGLVTVPDSEPATDNGESLNSLPKEATAHTEIQALLLNLGSDMGFDVWVAKNDRNKVFNGVKFADMTKMKAKLPLQFDDPTNRTIELIDVLWLKGNAIVAAFEIESTTSIYSGLLRMADLVAMQPNLNIPLYLVAPEERRDKVMEEVNRPTFSRLTPPLGDICRYLSFSSLQSGVAQFKTFAKFLKPDIMEELSEDCAIAD